LTAVIRMRLPSSRAGRLIVGGLLAAPLAAATLYAVLTSQWAAERVKRELTETLASQLDAIVSLDDVTVSLVPRTSIRGRGLVLTKRQDPSRGAFVTVREFEVRGSPLRLLRRRLDTVTAAGVLVRVQRGHGEGKRPPVRLRDVVVGTLRIQASELVIVPQDERRLPLRFDLHDVVMREFSFAGATAYQARLSNPLPRGQIVSEGRFGPVNTAEFSATPVSGTYRLQAADLGTINGLAGVLTSDGRFDGVLDRIAVSGTTTTPEFGLNLTAARVPLDTTFKALVDGTTGDTTLESVEARLGATGVSARGTIAGTPGAPGRTIQLAVTVTDGRFEDLLRLAIDEADPPMRGTLTLDAAFALPPGETDVATRLELTGTFRIDDGQFTSDAVQDRIDTLSRRGRGEPRNQDVQGVLSSLGGRMELRSGVLQLPRFRFTVVGATVTLGGRYRLHDAGLDFRGSLALGVPLSQTTTGFKSFLLKAIDPLFRKQGAGALVPIRIGGTVKAPTFGLDVGRVLR
jgi:hypothetical protein